MKKDLLLKRNFSPGIETILGPKYIYKIDLVGIKLEQIMKCHKVKIGWYIHPLTGWDHSCQSHQTV